MSRISIDVTPVEHQKLKAMAALEGKSIKEYVIERTLGSGGDSEQQLALEELESLLDARIRGAKRGSVSRRKVGEIFKDVGREPKPK
jgi:ParD-like antitoxin of type II ParDE toxin-antitoxin system